MLSWFAWSDASVARTGPEARVLVTGDCHLYVAKLAGQGSEGFGRRPDATPRPCPRPVHRPGRGRPWCLVERPESARLLPVNRSPCHRRGRAPAPARRRLGPPGATACRWPPWHWPSRCWPHAAGRSAAGRHRTGRHALAVMPLAVRHWPPCRWPPCRRPCRAAGRHAAGRHALAVMQLAVMQLAVMLSCLAAMPYRAC